MKSAEEFHSAIASLANDVQERLDYETEVGYFPTYVENLRALLAQLELHLRP